MLTIDTANSMQIRPAMDVVCAMTINSSAQITGLSSEVAKLYDNIEPNNYPMRQLADLQDEGFRLDGSAELYEIKEPSEANGKLGLRTTLQTYGKITLTADDVIQALTVRATGSGAIRVGSASGPAYTVVDGGVTIVPFGRVHGDLYFISDDENRRIEVSSIEAGARFEVSNENLISCNVSLRSDLQILNPTLPASEIAIEMSYPDDLSEMLVDLPEGVPITYSAGYPGSMSPERQFYLEEQGAAYEQGRLTIKGQDAIYKLDEPITESYTSDYNWDYDLREVVMIRPSYFHKDIYELVSKWLTNASVSFSQERSPWRTGGPTDSKKRNKNVLAAKPLREWIAYLMSALHQDYPANFFYDTSDDVGRAFWLTYVDAGIPKLSWRKPTTAKWVVQEEDLGDIKTNVERYYNEITQKVKGLVWSGLPPNDENGYLEEISEEMPYLQSVRWYTSDRCKNYHARYKRKDDDEWLPEDSFYGLIYYENLNFVDISWNRIVMWDGEIPKRLITAQKAAEVASEEKARKERTGIAGEVSFEWIGDANLPGQPKVGFYAAKKNGSYTLRLLPGDFGLTSLFNRSRRTGSFTYKGDPRWQPRDVLQINKRDGTTQLVTLENITLKHERGGLITEATYREGIV